MGRHIDAEELVRNWTWGSIIFGSDGSVVMKYGNYSVRFHRYFSEKSTKTQTWYIFRKQLRGRAYVTPIQVFEMANKFEVQWTTKIIKKEDK